MGINNKVQKIKNTIHNLQLELKIIQKECNHLKQSLKIIRPGEVRWVCNKCELKLKWPTTNELNDWI
jgi:transposase-like protein